MLVTRIKVLNLVSLLVMKQPSGENVLLFNNCPTPPRGTPEARGKGGVSGLMVQILRHKSTFIHTWLVSAFETFYYCKYSLESNQRLPFSTTNAAWKILSFIYIGGTDYKIVNLVFWYHFHTAYLSLRRPVLEHGRGNVWALNSSTLLVDDPFKAFFVDCVASQCLEREVFGL